MKKSRSELINEFFKTSNDKKSEETKIPKNYDFVKNPNHYNGHIVLGKKDKDSEKEPFIMETIDYLDSRARRFEGVLNYDELHSYIDCGKYYDRAGDKPEEGKTVRGKLYEDIGKMIWYLNHCRELMEKNGLE